MPTTTKSAKAAELLAARRARVSKLRRRCVASVLSAFVLAFGVLTVNPTTTTTDSTTAAVSATTSATTSTSASSTASTDDELAAVSTAQS